MSDGRSSSELRSLIEAARADGPGVAARAKVWGTLSNTLGAGAAAGMPAPSGLGGLSAAKALLAGTLLGGAVRVGLAAAALTLRPLPAVEPPSAFEPGAAVPVLASDPSAGAVLRVAAIGASVGATENAVATGSPSPAATDRSVAGAEALPARGAGTSNGTFGGSADGAPSPARATARPSLHRNTGVAPAAASGARTSAPDDDLGREAWLLADARTALARGDAAGALRSVHATLGVPNRQLVPEELALEAKALRALGRSDEAAAVESSLRTRFPDSPLVR
jgi:hypothetical protein